MTRWLFENWISHFIECLKRGPGVDLRNRHLLILDGHNSHVTLEVVKISMESGLDIVSLPSHTSHALQPLDIACFKPFKTAFRQIRDAWCLRNKNLPVGKQTLCEWTSIALKRALIASNIQSGFKRAGIWPLDREASKSSMAPSQGFKEAVTGVQNGAATGATNHMAGGPTCPTGHPVEANGLVTNRADHGRSAHVDTACMHAAHRRALGGVNSADSKGSDPARGQDDGGEDCFVDSTEPPPHHEVVSGAVHYYVAIRSSEESADPPGEANVDISPGCNDHLQQEGDHGDISTFLALPEIIPTRQRRRPQPLLDFTKSKILTSRMYTESCERLLAQKEATQAEAKRKAELQEATKETQRREKADHDLQVRARKEARNAKKEERLRSEAEKRLHGGGRERSIGAPPTSEAPPESPHVAATSFPPPAISAFGACGAFEVPNPTKPPASSVLPAFRAPPLPQIP